MKKYRGAFFNMNQLIENCPQCDAPQSSFNHECNACGTFLGFPNVRIANLSNEVQALETRVQISEKRAKLNDVFNEFSMLMDEVDQHSSVIVSMPVDTALNIVMNINYLFVNYERLVGAGARSPAEFVSDAHRKVVAGALYGSFGEKIVYGALSLSERGLKSYGDIHCKLKAVAVNKRTLFLHENSYVFIDKYGDSDHPKGYRSDWANRAKLVATKLEENKLLQKKQGREEWEQLMLVCDGKNRDRDEFVEAHIFGAFNVFSIEQMIAAEPIDKSKKNLVSAVIKGFDSVRQKNNQLT